MGNVGTWLAFGAGALSFLSPCVLPLVPAYLAMVTGMSASDIREGQASRLRAATGAILFMLGFAAVFVAMQLTVSAVSRTLVTNQVILRRLGGAVVVSMAVVLALEASGKTTIFSREFRPSRAPVSGNGTSRGGQRGAARSLFAAPLVGMAFAFGWTPCIGPVLGSVLAIAGTQETAGRGAILLLAYSAGLGVPFVAVALGASKAVSALGRLKKSSTKLMWAGSVGLAAFGILLLTNRTSAVAIWLQRLFLGLGLDRLAGI